MAPSGDSRAHPSTHHPWATPGKQPEHACTDGHVAVSVPAVCGPSFDKLTEIKEKYDPDNVFSHNVNVPPKGKLYK